MKIKIYLVIDDKVHYKVTPFKEKNEEINVIGYKQLIPYIEEAMKKGEEIKLIESQVIKDYNELERLIRGLENGKKK